MKIQITPYNEAWAEAFQNEAKAIMAALPESGIQVEHIGSTSVEGLAAKPIIDIMIGISDFSTADEYIPLVTSLGYEYISKYENQMPFRRFFIKRNLDSKSHHIHMVEIATPFWERHLRFRDYLRSHPETRDAYAKLKMGLVEKDWPDENAYAEAKTDFIRSVERKALNA